MSQAGGSFPKKHTPKSTKNGQTILLCWDSPTWEMLPGLDPVVGSPQVIDAHAVPSPKKREPGRIQLKDSAPPAALGEQLHLVPRRESPGDATEGDTFALMAGAGFGQAEDTNQALL